MKALNPCHLSAPLILLSLWAVTTNGASLTFSDPLVTQGDQISTVGDITGMTLNFDLVTGDYTAMWSASSVNPFTGNLRLNLNMGNASVGPQIVSLFGQFFAQQPTTQLSYSGNNPSLTLWHIGDTITTFGGPPTFTTSFNSGNVNLDNITTADRDVLGQTAVIAVPEPAQLTLLVVGGLSLFLSKRRGRRCHPTPR